MDFLEKFRKKNAGEAPQYHVKESHEAIVRPEVFDLVQEGETMVKHAVVCILFLAKLSAQNGVEHLGQKHGEQPAVESV